MRIAIGSDHAGFGYKEDLARLMREEGHEVTDVGTYDTASADYPDYAEKVALAIRNGEADRGVLICGSAVGVCVAANKVPGVRAGVSHIIGIELAREILRTFLSARYEAEERFQRRLDKVLAIEKNWLR
jgi:ribose 5-phosphate isomerase B